ncbi:Uncharacterised protein [Streptococcus pyogenes]|uniref:hypothetical protein n=1 Tax=Streptococcus pyogenes TaxID=1314 RepID=UPI000F6CDF0D|nr:hypothetical protein [Streptococcus pyogenes]VED99747.1 Uncharacterised protein [Streptococcus pyogenes]
MAKIDIIDNYETLLISVEELEQVLESLHAWLDKDIDWDSQCDCTILFLNTVPKLRF